MSIADQRAFLIAFRKCGNVAEAATLIQQSPKIHRQFMKDEIFRRAFDATVAEMEEEKRAKDEPPPAPEIKRRGRPRKQLPAPESREEAAPAEAAPQPVNGSDAFPMEQAATDPAAAPEPPPVVEHFFPGNRGYTKIFAPAGVEVQPPAEDPPKRQVLEPDPVATAEVTVASDAQQRQLIDEYGELDRRMQLRATDTSKYESLKRAIKTWFSGVPADADGTVEGEVYLLHLSACERERRICDNAALAAVIGMEKFFELARVPLGPLEDLLGKAHVASLTVESRTGSRRIKAIPKRPAAIE